MNVKTLMLDLHGFLWKPVAEETYGSSESEQDETAWKAQENCPGRCIVSLSNIFYWGYIVSA